MVILRLASRTQTLRFQPTSPAKARGHRPRESRHLRTAGQPSRRLATEVGARGSVRSGFSNWRPASASRRCSTSAVWRQSFIEESVERLRKETAKLGVKAEIYGRPKHIYSIYNKMRTKRPRFFPGL